MQYTSVVAEESTVAAGDIDQHGRETVVARSAIFPQCRFGPSCVAMATAAGIAGINRSETSVAVVTGAYVVVEAVAVVETDRVGSCYPVGVRIVGDR